LIFEIYIICF
jgi:hypothetical protein